MSLREKMAAKKAKKLAAKIQAKAKALQPDWAVDRVYKSAAVLETLRAGGDDETAVRPIRHYAVFDNRGNADIFIARLKAAGGYDNITITPIDGSPDFGVDFHEMSTTQTKDIFDKTVIAEGRAREAGGSYDGWETQVIAN